MAKNGYMLCDHVLKCQIAFCAATTSNVLGNSIGNDSGVFSGLGVADLEGENWSLVGPGHTARLETIDPGAVVASLSAGGDQ